VSTITDSHQHTADSLERSAIANAAPIISAHDLTVSYNGEPALEAITVTLNKGERIALIGPNGAGKSTFIKAIMRILRPLSGSIQVKTDLERIGYVAQNQEIKWDFPATVRDVVLMGCARRIGWLRQPTRAYWQIAEAALEQVGMGDLANQQIGELSGGQRKRAFIARALAQDAELLIMDEPFSGVDASAEADLLDLLDRLNANGLTILLSTHDLDLAFRRFDKVMAVRRHLVAYGTPQDVYTTDALRDLYGGRIVTLPNGDAVSLFVDDHHCGDC
jgi:ABC-type Mn2+/Zn2+ transport system ATPase subunit